MVAYIFQYYLNFLYPLLPKTSESPQKPLLRLMFPDSPAFVSIEGPIAQPSSHMLLMPNLPRPRCAFGEGNDTPFQYSCLEVPWTEEPVRLQSMGLLRVGHDWATSLSLFTFMHWRRKWQPTPVFLPGESQGWRSLVGCRLWGCTESDTTEAT